MKDMEADLKKIASRETEGNVSLLVRRMVQEGLVARSSAKAANISGGGGVG